MTSEKERKNERNKIKDDNNTKPSRIKRDGFVLLTLGTNNAFLVLESRACARIEF